MSYSFNPLLLLGLDLSGAAAGGSASYKDPVADEASLPTVGNSDGDVRVVKSTDHIYVWDATSSKWIDTGITLASAIGSTPNAAGVVINQVTTGNVTHQELQLEPANASFPGVLTTVAQTIAGNKTLTGTTNLSALTASTPLKLDGSKNIVSSSIVLTSDVSGVLPIANGGTNSSASLSGNKAVVTNGSAIIESAVTSTELGYVSGVSSAIQTQLNNKQPLDSTLTALASYNTNGLLTQTSADNFTGRTIVAGSSKASINNGDGISGNPSIDVVEANLTLNNIGGTLGISKGGTGQATNTLGFNALSPITAKGDLISSDGINNVRFPAGANGSAIVADSTQTIGLKYVPITVASSGDIAETSFAAANNQAAATNVTGLAFANASVRAFDALVSVYINATGSLYEEFKLRGIQKGASWDLAYDSAGDTSGVIFSITNTGQVQYQSTNVAAFTSSIFKFRAISVSV